MAPGLTCIRCLDGLPHPWHDNGEPNPDERYEPGGPMAPPKHLKENSVSWIGLVGRAGVGKDYTAERMAEIDERFCRVSFADEVRFEIQEAFGWDRFEVLWSKPYPEVIRRLLQWWGTDLRRSEDSEYWVNKTEQHAINAMADTLFPVFTDVRFGNEADMIRRNNGILVRVEASESVRRERLGGLPWEHSSESESDRIPCDMTVVSEVGNPKYSDEVQAVVNAALAPF